MSAIPILFKEKYECCGCGVCQLICPNNAIQMSSDSEGFDYPVIDEARCVSCGLCTKNCPQKQSVL